MQINFNSDGSLKIDNIEEKQLKGYQYDSLVYRYIRAREHMAEWEWERDRAEGTHTKTWYCDMAKRDIMRFCQILDEVIGEHN